MFGFFQQESTICRVLPVLNTYCVSTDLNSSELLLMGLMWIFKKILSKVSLHFSSWRIKSQIAKLVSIKLTKDTGLFFLVLKMNCQFGVINSFKKSNNSKMRLCLSFFSLERSQQCWYQYAKRHWDSMMYEVDPYQTGAFSSILITCFHIICIYFA